MRRISLVRDTADTADTPDPAESRFDTPLRLASPDWVSSFGQLRAHGDYQTATVTLERDAGPDAHPDVIVLVRVESEREEQEITVAAHELVPLYFALQGAIAAGQALGMIPVESPRQMIERGLGSGGGVWDVPGCAGIANGWLDHATGGILRCLRHQAHLWACLPGRDCSAGAVDGSSGGNRRLRT